MSTVALPDGLRASKVLAVHLNYRSRAAQRGRVPAHPSYFLKPPSTLAGSGEVRRPEGAQLLAFEGEIALILRSRVRAMAPEACAAAIGWVAAANDFGIHDMRWADAGSNVLSKGHDGFTPLGDALPADEVDLDRLSLRTLVNGETVQEDDASGLLFGFAHLLADLGRVMTLEPGDVVLTGTPAGSTTVVPGDVVEVQVGGRSHVRSTVVAADALPGYGAMPRARAQDRASATGVNAPRPVTLTPAAADALREVSTATLSTQLLRRGIANTFLTGLTPARPDLRMLGYARTLRYGAARSDVRAAMEGEDAQKRAVESTSPGDVLVIEARGQLGAGTIGDILAARVHARGGAGIVTDGAVRDAPGVTAVEIPTYLAGMHAASLWERHQPLDADLPITCAGVLVVPGDVLVGDAEGVVVLPAACAEEVAHDALEQEDREAFAIERVRAGASIRGLYPLADEHRPAYERWLHERRPSAPATHRARPEDPA